MGKFKAGDKVRVKDIKIGTVSHGYNFVYGMTKYIGKIFTIGVCCDDSCYMLKEAMYCWAEDWLEPVNRERITIYRNGDKTVALDKTTGRKAEAKCSKDDEYDFYTGAKIAFNRLVGEDKAREEPMPKLYNGKVVCIKSTCEDITEGKIYEFKDGYSKYDDGNRMPLMRDAVTSFEDLVEKMSSEFVELVEESK